MKKLFTTLAFVLMALTSHAQRYHLDVNDDGKIELNDALIIIDYILGRFNPDEQPKSYLTCPDDNHPHLIDLGLPSGTKWACCNVGAYFPENYGLYFAWGETETKSTYTESNYIYYDNSTNSYQDIGSDICGTYYDVAHVKWGEKWQMPSYVQIKELLDNCTFERTTLDGINGCKLSSKNNGGAIFLPAAGYRVDWKFIDRGNYGNYSSGTLNPYYIYDLCNLFFNFNEAHCYLHDGYYRHVGYTVRPVWLP